MGNFKSITFLFFILNYVALAQDNVVLRTSSQCTELAQYLNMQSPNQRAYVFDLKKEYLQIGKANAVAIFVRNNEAVGQTNDIQHCSFIEDYNNVDKELKKYTHFYPADFYAANMSNIFFIQSQLKNIHRQNNLSYQPDKFLTIGPMGFHFTLKKYNTIVYDSFDFNKFIDEDRYKLQNRRTFSYSGFFSTKEPKLCDCQFGVENIASKGFVTVEDEIIDGYAYALQPMFKCLEQE